MVTNLTQEAKAKWAEAIAAKDPELKLRLLKEFYSLMPKHKATEKLEMSIKRQIAALEEEVEQRRSRKRGSTRQEWTVKKEGSLQVALVGTINSSLNLFERLTGLSVSIYDALMRPRIGVFSALNIRAQMVLTPLDYMIGEDRLDKFISIARNADAIMVVVDSSKYMDDVCKWFEARSINILARSRAEIEYTPHGGIRIVGRSDYVDEGSVFNLIKSYGIKNVIVRLYSNTTLEDVEDAIFGRISKDAVFVAFADNVCDVNGIDLIRFNGDKDSLMLDLLKHIGLIRVFTKKVGSDPVDEPLLMHRGSKVIELAERIHKDFARAFKYARVWRHGSIIKVGKDFILDDLDVVELHA
ncbi:MULTISPECIES: TGS domain-containing protein [Candidatus Nitrosocaldus]|jgi:ribosome-interacting GTPase 1|uniref:Putative TGS domain protein n=1 Tax=Candidatus Nitrosocaldus cavascurensis TaxID=2058097 RepID=A0A2K5APV3_9ARCH|nr:MULTISPECIES: TGS domain-containing protein [Candidatus Nitrosocaldus]SPC33670.1 putative TGS domain protein [Candidatus Nitrosocaldus cavascurensis]